MLYLSYEVNELNELKKLYEKYYAMPSHSFNKKEVIETWEAIRNIEDKVQNEAIHYYKSHIEELEKDIFEEFHITLIVCSDNDPNYVFDKEWLSWAIANLTPFLNLFPKEQREKIKREINEIFRKKKNIIGTQYADNLIKKAKKIDTRQHQNSPTFSVIRKEKNLNAIQHRFYPHSLIFNGKAISALGKAKTRGKIDKMSSTMKIEGVNIFMPESTFKIGVGTAKIFRYAVAEFTKHNSQNIEGEKIKLRILLDVKDYAEANGVDINSESAMKNFRFKLRKNLETLRYSGVSWEEKIKGKSQTFGAMNYIGAYELKGDTLEIEFTLKMAEYLTSLPLIQYPRTLYLLDNQETNAFAIGEAMCLHYSQDNNVIRKTEGKLKVETLLTYTSFPTWEELKAHKWSWERYVKEPFERALDKLTQCGFLKDWEYQYEGGVKIPDDEAEIKTYREFISLIVKFELTNFQNSNTRAIEIKKKKEEQIKKLQSNKRKKYKKADDNTTL